MAGLLWLWGGGGGGGGGMDIFWSYTIQKKCNFPAKNIVRCLLLIMIVDKFATHTCISRHTLCLIITTQFTTDWRNRDVQRRFFVNCFNFYKRQKRSCLSSLLFLPHQNQRWLHLPHCLAVFITGCKRLGLWCRSSVFALVCGMIAILISIFK